jgi:hypothetical protein
MEPQYAIEHMFATTGGVHLRDFGGGAIGTQCDESRFTEQTRPEAFRR